jgi:hypothetical protein
MRFVLILGPLRSGAASFFIKNLSFLAPSILGLSLFLSEVFLF